jgi:predicted DNA binding CopG/RHH family protein
MIGPKSARITIVLPAAVLERLKAQADAQGRSMSNLASVLLQEAFGKLGRRDG